MKILFYGAGVMGSLYAARLRESGQDVSVLARGQRLADIREYGIVLEDVSTGNRTTTRVNIHETDGLGQRRILTDRKIVELITEYIISQNIAAQMQHSDLGHNPAIGCQPGKVSVVKQL